MNQLKKKKGNQRNLTVLLSLNVSKKYIFTFYFFKDVDRVVRFLFEAMNLITPVSSMVAVPLALLRGTSELIMSGRGENVWLIRYAHPHISQLTQNWWCCKSSWKPISPPWGYIHWYKTLSSVRIMGSIPTLERFWNSLILKKSLLVSFTHLVT